MATRPSDAQPRPPFPPPAPGRTHDLPSTAQTVRSGILDPSAPAAVTVASGDVVAYSHTWVQWGNHARYGMSFAEREPLRRQFPRGPYSNVGPVVIEGAEPGDVVECRMLRLRPIDWGWNSFPLGVGALPADFTEPYLHYFRFDEARRTTPFVDGIELPLAPFQGVIATEPAGDQPVSAILSGPYGGNLVLRELVAGTSLFLPVFKAGARIWTSDSHAAQGDGVVDQTAIETAMEELQVQYVLHKRVPLALPLAETPTHWIGLGFADTLDAALVACLRNLITWLAQASGIAAADAYALCSLAVSFRVTQYADQTGSVYTATPPKAIHGMAPKAVFPDDLRRRIDAFLRPANEAARAPAAGGGR